MRLDKIMKIIESNLGEIMYNMHKNEGFLYIILIAQDPFGEIQIIDLPEIYGYAKETKSFDEVIASLEDFYKYYDLIALISSSKCIFDLSTIIYLLATINGFDRIKSLEWIINKCSVRYSMMYPKMAVKIIRSSNLNTLQYFCYMKISKNSYNYLINLNCVDLKPYNEEFTKYIIKSNDGDRIINFSEVDKKFREMFSKKVGLETLNKNIKF